MKQNALTFVIKLLFFNVVVFAIIFFCIMPQYSTEYNAAMIDKVDVLEDIDAPKIIIVGGSSVAFGIDSIEMQEALDMPVINVGLHAGLGSSFHSDVIKDYIAEGDIVVIAPESYDSVSTAGDIVLTWLTIENHFKLWGGVNDFQYYDMFKSYPTYLKRIMNLWVAGEGNRVIDDNAYARSAFNGNGDNVFPRPILKFEASDIKFASSELSDAMELYWNEYNAFVQSKNARLFMSSPPIMDNDVTVNLNLLEKELDEKLDFPRISNFNDYIYPQSYFFDNPHHLNDVGKKIRTEQLISDIKRQLSTEG